MNCCSNCSGNPNYEHDIFVKPVELASLDGDDQNSKDSLELQWTFPPDTEFYRARISEPLLAPDHWVSRQLLLRAVDVPTRLVYLIYIYQATYEQLCMKRGYRSMRH
jgi:hypothetical protein